MAAVLPAKLKTGDIPRFAKRAVQLEKFRPIISYWCEYYILQQILAKQLHAQDEECSAFAIQLMDKLERVKADNAGNDAIVDDLAAQAYVENFGLETFKRADDAQRGNKVTVQTADTFQAASTFFDLVSIWGGPDREIAAKGKFAKFHATRILKAIKAGEDPNATNPVIEEPPQPDTDGIEEELKDLERQEGAATTASYQPPVVENAHDEGFPAPMPGFHFPTEALTFHGQVPGGMKVDEAQAPEIESEDSMAAEYFPMAQSQMAPYDVGMNPSEGDHALELPPEISPPHDAIDMPQNFYSADAEPPSPIASPFHAHGPPPPQIPTDIPFADPTPALPAPVIPAVPIASTATPTHLPANTAYRTDDESTMLAQKHAKWAISALNFEDVNTAVKELRLALQSLGA